MSAPRADDAAQPAIEVSGLTRRFGRTTALDGVSFEVPHGAKVALLGSNGAGKSTLLAILSTLLSPASGTARIEVYGEYAEGWLGPQGEGRTYNQGWVLLGAQSAALRVGFDRDVVPVGRNEGGFAKMRLNVRDRAITLKEVKIVYGNGETDIIPVNTRIDAGGSYGPLDLIGKARTIREVELTYRSRFIDPSAKGKGAAVVEIWGLH